MHTTVVNIRNSDHDVYIGRPRNGQPWNFGNPFRVGRDGQRDQCVHRFRVWLETGMNFGCPDATDARRAWMLDNLSTLKGKRLGCFCSPSRCHGDVLAALANEL